MFASSTCGGCGRRRQASAEDVRVAVADLLEGRKAVDAVAIDLRNNPGGLLAGGVDTAR